MENYKRKENSMNPFSPGFGKLPPIYVGRTEDTAKLLEELGNPNSPYQTTLVYGMRGTGKTSFITDVSQEVQKRKKWIVVNLAMGSPLVPVLVDAIYQKAEETLKNAIKMISGVSVSAFGITLKVDNKEAEQRQYQNLLETILKKLKKDGTWLLITIDEVKSTPEVCSFASVYQLMLREGYNISLIMTGLPENVSELQNNDVLTFLLRAGRIVLNPLNLWDIKSSYIKAFEGHKNIGDNELIYITRLTSGYAYAFQLLGYYLWENSDSDITEDTIAGVMPFYKNDLFRNSYTKIYQSLSPKEQEFVNAMADTETMPVPVEEIGAKLKKDKNYISVYRRRLLDTQIVLSPKRGFLQFTLPFFKEFVKENRLLFE